MTKQKAHLKALEVADAQRRLSKEELLQPRIVERDFPIASMGGSVRLKSMSFETRRQLRAATKWGTEEYDDDLFTLLAITDSLVDPKLTRDEVEQLKEQDVQVIEEIALKLIELNMFGKAEELKKGSKETPNSDSP